MSNHKECAIVFCERYGILTYAGAAANEKRLRELLVVASRLGINPQILRITAQEADHIAEILGTREKK